ncbi:MAG: DUF1598 domain-containing protein [Betaproteobacteria bacterium]|nr:DUF1598 domain-containing protein [Betaproteobacteria bacterium]
MNHRIFYYRSWRAAALVMTLASAHVHAGTRGDASPVAGRSMALIIEPPPPPPEAAWPRVRQEQLSFAERLKEWGMTVEIERKDELAMENSPNLFTFSMSWTGPSKFEVQVGVQTPETALSPRAGFKYKGEFSDEGMQSASSAKIEFSNGQRFSVALTSSERSGLGYEVGFGIERAFAELQGKFDSTAPVPVSYSTEINLTKLYRIAQGAMPGPDEAGSVKLKINPETYAHRFLQFAPRFAEFSAGPAMQAANAVTIQANPILLAAAITNDVSLWARQKAVASVRQGLKEELPKGVRIHFNDHLLAQMLQKGGKSRSRDGFNRLANELERTRDSETRAALVRDYIKTLKAVYRQDRPRRIATDVTLVSLRALVTAAESYVRNWNDLPAPVRAPGGIARITGYLLDQARDDVLLIGETIPGAPALTIDDLIVGVRAVWKDDATPFCSLDPDPADLGGDQYVRVSGVPADSGFARTMVEADYTMKRLMAGLGSATSPGYKSYLDLMRHALEQGNTADVANRFWFYPAPLETGDIEISPDGALVLFKTGVQVLSEQMVISQDGLLGTGDVDAIADQWAAGLTKALPELASTHPEFQRLHGLFDVVLMAKTWRKLDANSQWFARLAALPYTKAKLPVSYKGVEAVVMKD